MRGSIRKEFGKLKPRAIVLDDNPRARVMTARSLRLRGFDVAECGSAEEFAACWMPGTVDVIVADWQLSAKESELGDRVLERVRTRDWDVPFVLVSGKLEEDAKRVDVLARLLESGGARFVKRGSAGIRQACEEAEDLIERRDLALLKIILSLREGALKRETIATSSGQEEIAKILERIVSQPAASHDAERPIAQRIAGQGAISKA